MSCTHCKKEPCDFTPISCRDCGYCIFSFKLCDECYDMYRDTGGTPRCEKCEDVLTFAREEEKEEQLRELLGVKQCKPVPTYEYDDDDVFD